MWSTKSKPWPVAVLAPVALLAIGLWLADATPSRAQSEAPVADDARKGYSVGVFVNDDEASDTAYLGVQLEEETEHPEGGARVTHVVDGSPADEAGIREGDIIVEFDGRVIRGPVGLTRRIHDSSPGDHTAIVVVRDGRRSYAVRETGLAAPLGFVGDAVGWIGVDQVDRLPIEKPIHIFG